MAAIPYAYSIEIDDIIDPEQAYELFWSEAISDPSAFACPIEGCNGKVTCINIDKTENDMLQHPHYRGYNHTPGCELTRPLNSGKASKASSESTSGKSDLDELFLKRPEKTTSTTNNNHIVSSGGNRGSTSGKSDKIYKSKYFTIRSLVSKFATYRKLETTEETYVKIGDNQISYKNLFVGIYNQNPNNLPLQDRIYWGVAFLDKVKSKNFYIVKFEKSFISDDKNIRPSFILSQGQLENYHSKLIGKRINLYSKQESPRVIVFIYGKPYLNRKDDREYCNFKLDSLDLLDIRSLDFFEKLKKE